MPSSPPPPFSPSSRGATHRATERPWAPSGLREALTLSLIVLAYELGLWAFSYWLFPFDPFPGLSSRMAATPAGWIGYAVVAVLLAPVVEEILFRGYLLRSYAAARGLRFALYGEAILFGLFHLHPLRMLRSFGFAWILGRAVLARGSLVPAVAAHMATNALGFAMIHLVPDIPPPSPVVGISAGIAALLAIGVTARRLPVAPAPPSAPGPVLSGSLVLTLLILLANLAYGLWH